MKWTLYDDEIMRQRVHKLQVDAKSTYHEVRIFSRQEMHPVAMLKRTRHFVQVNAGPYGETVYEHDMPFGTTLTDAKKRAIELAKQANSDKAAEFEFSGLEKKSQNV